ncbi:efflux RND transporter periplasmic adaptor subunit [Sphaerotilus sp.]|uniref:efflux RND transporter periplasmic adaptor subunit n=1 Tax=Sphaerotilus sp. TaxID=2093942 RepID=UPI0034E26455
MTTPTALSPAPVASATGNSPAELTALLGADAVAAPWWRRRTVWIGAALLVAVGAGVTWWQGRQVAQTAPRYVTEPVVRGNLAITVTANGTLQPTHQVSIGSELSGTIKRVHVDVNDTVHAGQVLIELDTSKLGDQLTRSRATLASAQSAVQQAEATVAEQRSNLDRLEEVARLSGGKVPSKAELDTGHASVARASATLAMARASVADARAAVRLDETNLAKASIRSPIDGVVLTRTAEPGNAVAASLQAVTLLTLAEDLRHLNLQVKVDEADVGMVKTGQSARFTVSAWPARRWPATISRVAFGSTITDNVVTYPTDLQVANDDLDLRPGMTATATIAATERQGVLMVPNAALRFTPAATSSAAASGGSLVSRLMPRPPGSNAPKRAGNSAAREGSQRQLWILQGQQAVPLTVTTGLSNGRMTEVSGAGLSADLAVIVSQASAAP